MKWNGFECREFDFESFSAKVIIPEKTVIKSALALKTTYFNAFPETEIALLEQGMLLCFIECESRWGKPSDTERMARFVKHVAKEYGIEEKCVPVGMSCGGLMAVQLAAKHPEIISCLYLDAPVMNLMSCPCGFGVGRNSSSDLSEIFEAFGFKSMSELICYREMPMHNIPSLVKNRIPVVMVAGDSDEIVPYCENGILLENAYSETDIDLEVYIKPGCNHHPHGLDDVSTVVDFIMRHTDIKKDDVF